MARIVSIGAYIGNGAPNPTIACLSFNETPSLSLRLSPTARLDVIHSCSSNDPLVFHRCSITMGLAG
jgi:hypothetical protein